MRAHQPPRTRYRDEDDYGMDYGESSYPMLYDSDDDDPDHVSTAARFRFAAPQGAA